jgi:hypothetical protein
MTAKAIIVHAHVIGDSCTSTVCIIESNMEDEERKRRAPYGHRWSHDVMRLQHTYQGKYLDINPSSFVQMNNK